MRKHGLLHDPDRAQTRGAGGKTSAEGSRNAGRVRRRLLLAGYITARVRPALIVQTGYEQGRPEPRDVSDRLPPPT